MPPKRGRTNANAGAGGDARSPASKRAKPSTQCGGGVDGNLRDGGGNSESRSTKKRKGKSKTAAPSAASTAAINPKVLLARIKDLEQMLAAHSKAGAAGAATSIGSSGNPKGKRKAKGKVSDNGDVAAKLQHVAARRDLSMLVGYGWDFFLFIFFLFSFFILPLASECSIQVFPD